MKKTPASSAHCNTARGMVRSGSRTSPPSVVALSKPTKLKMESTSAGPSALKEAPLRWN